MDPRYFAHTLSLFEAELYLRGLQRRAYAGWEQARYAGFLAAKPHCAKEFELQDLGRFYWENEGRPIRDAEQEKKELAAARARARRRDEEFLKKMKNGIG